MLTQAHVRCIHHAPISLCFHEVPRGVNRKVLELIKMTLFDIFSDPTELLNLFNIAISKKHSYALYSMEQN